MATLPSDFYQVAYFDVRRAISLAMMMSGNFQAGAMATQASRRAVPRISGRWAMVVYRQDDAAGSSAILYIAKPGS